MGRMSRTKGAAFECLIVRLYRERFGWDPRECYRSAPLQAAAGDRAGDITTPMPVWHELGHGKQIAPHAKLVQAEEACRGESYAVAVTRQDGRPIMVTLSVGSLVEMVMPSSGTPSCQASCSIVTMTWDDWLDLVDEWWAGVRR